MQKLIVRKIRVRNENSDNMHLNLLIYATSSGKELKFCFSETITPQF